MPAEACLAALDASRDGLTSTEARARLERFGRNELPRSDRPGLLRLFVRQFKSPLIYLLVGAAIVSLLVGQQNDAGFIIAVLLVNAGIGAFQESRAETSMEALQSLIRLSARVRRDGDLVMIDAAELVLGDRVEIESGMAVPGDVRLLSTHGLRVDESLLTGESLAVTKDAGAIVASDAGLADRASLLHAGTTVVEGRAAGVVVATGSGTALGLIDRSLRTMRAAPPPLLLRLAKLSRQIAVAAVLLIALLAAALAVEGQPANHILLLSVALAVSAVPEGLPIAVTVALAAATRRMASRNVIVRSLPAVEGLGACTLIASDKTGTLTLNRLSVERVLLTGGLGCASGDWKSESARQRFMPLAFAVAVCNDASFSREGKLEGDPVDVALRSFALDIGVGAERLVEVERIVALPYEPVHRFASVVIRCGERACLYAKGAPETILPMCVDGTEADAGAVEELAAGGYRVLAVAESEPRDLHRLDPSAPSGLRLLGYVALLDPLRPEAADAVARCGEAGISVRMVTGDHPATALTIARQLGIAREMREVVTGADLAVLETQPDLLMERIRGARVFARIEPAQKLLLVRAFSNDGEIVAVTGDGVNDAPALQAAHIGVAMGKGGTDVAREASDLVLADDNFASIVAGVQEGRVTYGNVRKVIIFLLATGIAEIFMFLGSVLTGLPMPLTPVQLIWANLVTNGAQDVMLGFGKGEGDELKRPPRRPDEPLLNASAIALMLPPAAVMTAIALVMMHWSLAQGRDLATVQNLVLLLVVLFQNVYVLCMRSERRPIYREPPGSNPWLLLGVAAAIGLHLLAMNWPPLAGLLGTMPVDLSAFGFCLAAVVVLGAVTEATKWVVAWRFRPRHFARGIDRPPSSVHPGSA